MHDILPQIRRIRQRTFRLEFTHFLIHLGSAGCLARFGGQKSVAPFR